MSSFKDFSPYVFSFERLDKKITDTCTPSNYYQSWMKKYAELFKADSSTMNVVELDLRGKKSLREMFASATFFVEVEKDLTMRCYASYYFCLYYSLFHALWSVIMLDPKAKLNSILNITHQNLITIFVGTFANSKKDILDSGIKEQFYNLQYKREYYSYVTPINNLFRYQDDLERTEETIKDCFQLASFHSLMIEKSYRKNIN